ncbi:ATP-binding cassette domain-containing protein [Candidatus Bathyarchaeota archaeon]|nr:ATP-binding cassette domain-containing protein [Candidatus Bathyarchaeota archaeon]
MNALIEISDVWMSYGATQVLRGINLSAEEGDFIVIRGKSGAGKTTLLKIMGLLEPPDKGEVKIFGKATRM